MSKGMAIASLENAIFTPDRIHRLFIIFIAVYYITLAISTFYSNYGQPPSGDPTDLIDFSWIWAAGHAVVGGDSNRVYDFAYFSTLQRPILGTPGSGGQYSYVYPPNFLLYVAPLGLMSPLPALISWLASTFLLFYAALRRIVWKPLAVLFGAVPSAVSWNIKLGHTGFLAAGLIGLALSLIEQAPFCGGLVLGLLAYKPQLAVVFPIVLVAAGQWRALLGAAVSVAVVAAVTTIFFGFDLWLDFFHFFASRLASLRPDPLTVATQQSVYGVLVWLGVSGSIAKIIHVCVAAPIVVMVCMVWRRPVPYALKAAAAALGALIATPYVLAYDMVVLIVPSAFLLEEMRRSGFRPGERLALFSAWLILFTSIIPTGFFACAILFALVLRRVFGTMPAVA
jgi:arabinofuranan 3-O-arabinosyltransferase